MDLGHIRISDNIVDIPLPEKILETEFDESAEESTITIPRISIYYSSSGHSSSYEGSSDDSYQSSNV